MVDPTFIRGYLSGARWARGSTPPRTCGSQAGQARQTVTFPFTNAELETYLLKVENAILRSVGSTRKNCQPRNLFLPL